MALNVFTIYIKRRLTEIQFCNANTPPKRGVSCLRGDTSTQRLWRGKRPRARPQAAASET
ncbi:protein of unknown function (plasmid) [Cupriavidus neocaledonicus]|uniref:Uncharacterized protein n=1 Tax=Cupriavidus neocaledonicus TaxID=1040979 RepID=A0A375HV99_9BURK|nr:hypothetical protein CBM2605_B70044 [Cupriavidus neocaledonicus]SPD60610.1 protein of unknown function [Cupriavidus neocaledonicus]